MKKSLIVLVAVLAALLLALPTMAAGLKVSGEFGGAVTYDNGVVDVSRDSDGNWNKDDTYLKLVLDFSDENSAFVAHIPVKFWWNGKESGPISANLGGELQTPWYAAYAGAPLKLSIAGSPDDTCADYKFAGFGDPLGLVKAVDDQDVVVKAVGMVGGFGVNAQAIRAYEVDDVETLDTDEFTDKTYGLLRITYGLPGGYTVGGIYAAVDSVDKAGTAVTNNVNYAADITGPLPINEGATITAAIAQSRQAEGDRVKVSDKWIWGDWSDPKNAYEVNIAGVKAGIVELSGDFRAVAPDFYTVAADTSDDGKSDIVAYDGQRQFYGKAVIPLGMAGQAMKLTLEDDYRVNFDGSTAVSFDMTDTIVNKALWNAGIREIKVERVRPSNKVAADLELNPIANVKVNVGGSYKAALDDPANDAVGSYNDDYLSSVYGKVEYKPQENLTVNAGVEWRSENRYDNYLKYAADEYGVPQEEAAYWDREGSGVKLDGKVTYTPAPGIKVEGSAKYGTGTYDFFGDRLVVDNPLEDEGPVGKDYSRLDVDGYVEAKQSLAVGGAKGFDALGAGYLKVKNALKSERDTRYAVYGEAVVALTDKVSDKAAVYNGTTHTDNANDVRTILYNGIDYALSGNSTVSVGYSYTSELQEGNLYAAYKVKLGTAEVSLSYGESRLASDPCDADLDDGKPWAWLCNIGDAGTRDGYYKLAVKIPF
ncbi:MAG TPA: hypothetical protein GXX51_07465 [Firmicutes bacterium]|nr:hypothetical protein [Bacillota bacterium]